MAFESEPFEISFEAKGQGADQPQTLDSIVLNLGITPAQGAELANRLEGSSREVCLRLERGWMLYLKQGPSPRAIVAHPDSSSWVGTLILSEKDYAEFCTVLRIGQGVSSARWIRPSRFVNLEVCFSFKSLSTHP